MILCVMAIPQDNPAGDPDLDMQQMRRAQVDAAAFAPIYERYVDRVYAFCRRRASSDAEAEDLCSQVFTRALVGLAGYNGGMVAAWLFRIARNVIANHYRGQRPIISLEGIEIPTSGIGTPVEDEEERLVLAGLVDSLPEDKRLVLSLSLDGGLTSEEIGEVVGKSAGAVRVEVYRTIKSLRERFFRIMGSGS